jgi:hypothetical protein
MEQSVSSSLRNMLRQGRGAGFLAAVDAGSNASADLLDCVLNDSRWDRQVEERDDYYARLLLTTGTNVDEVRRYILEGSDEADESDFWLPIGVLAEMSCRGETSARDAMAEAVRSGARWRACLDALEAAGGIELVGDVISADVVQALISGVGIDDIADAVNVVAAPWERWAEQAPALRFVVRNGAGSTREARPMSGPAAWTASRIRKRDLPDDLAALSTKSLLSRGSTPGMVSRLSDEVARRTDPDTPKLLATAAESGTPEERHVALRSLGKRGSTEFVAAAEQFLRRETELAPGARRDHRLRRAFLQYLQELQPSVTLPLARRWFCEPWPLSLAAERVLERHATADDRGPLEAAGTAALETSDMYRLCSIVDAISAAGPDDSLPFLSEVYEQVPYSYARRRVVDALSRCPPTHATNRYLKEALWDCEPEARAMACRASRTLQAFPRARITEIARDLYEDDSVRDAARGVLGGAK